MRGDVVHERRARWSLGVEPSKFVGERMRLLKYVRRLPAERHEIPFVLHAEAPHRNAIDALLRGPRLVAPGDVIARVRGQHIHFGVTREVLGDVSRVEFRAAVNRLTVSLDDDRELHCSSSNPPGPDSAEGVDGPPCPEPGEGCPEASPSDPESDGGAAVGALWRAGRPAVPLPGASPPAMPMMEAAGAPPRRPRRRRRRLLR